jgi:hypothetical protein
LEGIMGRASRTTPIWISIGGAAALIVAAVLVANSTFAPAPSKRAGAVEPSSAPLVPSGDEQPRTAPGSPAATTIPDATPTPEPAPPLEDVPDAEPADEPNPVNQIADALPRGSSGMMIGIDPVTGSKQMPSPAFRSALQAPALDRSQIGLQVVHKPDGSRMIDLQDRFQDYTVVRIGPDGRKIETCVQGPDVDAALRAPAVPAPPPSTSTREER